MMETKKEKKKKSKVTLKISDEVKAPPLILSFPGGIPPAAKNVSFNVFSSSNANGDNPPKKKTKRRIIGENSWVTYEGNNVMEGSNLNRYLIGVYDKKKKVIDFQDAGHVFVMRAIPKKANEKPAENKDEGLNYMDRKRLLIESFGSRKKQRAVEAAQANVVKAENVAGAAGLDGLVDKFASPTKPDPANPSSLLSSPSAAQAAMEEKRRQLLPPFNMAAKKPSEVYKIQDIITPEMLSSVTNHLDESAFSGPTEGLVKVMTAKLEFIPKFVLSSIKQLSSLDDAGSAKMAKYLVMIRHMMALNQTRSRSFKKGIQVHAKDFKMPMSVLSQLLSRYAQHTEGNKGPAFSLPPQHKVKLQLHILVACLVIQKCQLDLSELREDLKLKPEQISSFARELGCVVEARRKIPRPGEKASMSKIAILKVPLQFPEPRKGGKK